MHLPAEHPNAFEELRQHCDDLQRNYDGIKQRLVAIEGTLSRIREASDSNTSERFAYLCAMWKRETRLMSNVTKKAIHPAYQQIIAMGYSAVPLILEDLATHGPEDWFWALTTITGENPITEDICGQMQAMTEAWIKWGMTKGYLRDSIPKTRQHSPASSESVTG